MDVTIIITIANSNASSLDANTSASMATPTSPTPLTNTSTPATTTTTVFKGYGDQLPLNFMLINYEFAVVIMIILAISAAVGTFGNLLILIAVATHRTLRSVEFVFVVNLACCDLYVTLFAEPLSIIAKTVGWKWFEGVPGLCRVIGYLCTMSCVGSLMSLTIMSLNRYVLICHNALYHAIFTVNKCLLYCLLVYLFGFFLIAFNFFGIGDHSFDDKSYECVWDRMASHDYTIGFAIVLVWVPITVTGLAYGKTYRFVRQAQDAINKSRGPPVPSSGAADNDKSSSVFTPTSTSSTQGGKIIPPGSALHGKAPPSNSKNGNDDHKGDSGFSGDDRIPEKGSNPGSHTAEEPRETHNGNDRLNVPQPDGRANGNGGGGAVKFSSATKAGSEDKAAFQAAPAGKGSGGGGGGGHPGLKLARPLFIIYVVFSTCWIPYSLVIIFDIHNTFPHELHAFITCFAHLNSTVNWLVYYYTHNKMRRAFQSLLPCYTVTRVSAQHATATTMATKDE